MKRTCFQNGVPSFDKDFTVKYPLATDMEEPRRNATKTVLGVTASHVDPLCLPDVAADCHAGRHSILKEVTKFEQEGRNTQDDKKSQRKASDVTNATQGVTFTCEQSS